MKIINGGVCAATGFMAGACHCGIRKNQAKDDLAIIYSQSLCQCAAVYTTNKVKAAPLKVTKEHLKNGMAQAIIVNSGNANACNESEMENANKEALCASKFLDCDVEDVVVASTGVIGQPLPIECIEQNIGNIELSNDNSLKAAHAILTTDTVEKTIAIEFEVNGTICHMGGICKGSGMIHPNMGTMLSFITTDCNIQASLLDEILHENVKKTFNRVSVDGDTSTNDMCVVMANGMAQNAPVTKHTDSYPIFKEALRFVMEELAKKIAADGEGAGKFLTCTVKGAKTEEDAEKLAMSVCSSSLLKAAMFGADANWGRVMCALGYAGVDFDPESVDIYFKSNDEIIQCSKDGMALNFDEQKAKEILSNKEIEIISDLKQGNEQVSCWGCDLTYDYVKINGDYRT
ncbi:bifunctional glutamate N-acetyltransferase/amino-acid acetyltransferase ArgJ [Floccifex sp.]|uniref:bifunctional glutamate N-acetyltransferase/amino-acid acetyltransferase ArgJ n=1 Tax=Floccifex sp. TaxID=2815810 RepID=UPI002A76233E|nr:bifunctional glutamate N-acetyltransferase/amino-acid acetyltransferase ArgJ [Floccifex sp.]MDD7280677.1 bifunctional glutamate N-acetyltransferase/amino-acid acetyltransferase ArgJ [Erysipelotrichaceae bacterium]MDY2957400.1 bifunctional glutamate N-acetyltransferase/amino-acid acetyltransferase ArgJ [Floccifex sp.]